MQIHCSLRTAHILLTVSLALAAADGTDSVLIEVIVKAPIHFSYKILQIFFSIDFSEDGMKLFSAVLLMLCVWSDSSYKGVSAA